MSCAEQCGRLGREILWAIGREYDWPGYDDLPEVKNEGATGE